MPNPRPIVPCFEPLALSQDRTEGRIPQREVELASSRAKGLVWAHGIKGFKSRVDRPCGIEPVVTHHSRNTGQSKTTHLVDRKQRRRKVAQEARVLVAKPGGLRTVAGTHSVEGGTQLP